jgi:hypothetical protein
VIQTAYPSKAADFTSSPIHLRYDGIQLDDQTIQSVLLGLKLDEGIQPSFDISRHGIEDCRHLGRFPTPSSMLLLGQV